MVHIILLQRYSVTYVKFGCENKEEVTERKLLILILLYLSIPLFYFSFPFSVIFLKVNFFLPFLLYGLTFFIFYFSLKGKYNVPYLNKLSNRYSEFYIIDKTNHYRTSNIYFIIFGILWITHLFIITYFAKRFNLVN
jgi:hypothetical protein